MLCAQRMGVQPTQCVVFEDADFGIQAARAAGMDAVDVRFAVSEALSLSRCLPVVFSALHYYPANSEVVLVAMLLSGVSHPWF